MKGRYSKGDILKALKDSGIKKGDSVYVSSSLGLIGFPPENIDSTDKLCELFFNAINEVIGKNGTLIVPTFSYTFGKGAVRDPAVFDPQITPADIGSLPNFCLKQKSFKRSLDPMISVACRGPRCDEFIKDLPPTSYGEGSFLSRLAKSDVKLLNLGIGPVWMPFVHYIDWLLKAPYRYDKIFKGLIKNGKKFIPTTWVYSVRTLIDNSYPNTEPVGRMAERKGLWRSASLGSVKIYSIISKRYFYFAKKAVQKNKFLLVKGPEVDVLKAERKRTRTDAVKINLGSFNMENWIRGFTLLRRDLISDNMDSAFLGIQKSFNLQLTKVRTGEHCLDWIIPERQVLKDSEKISSLGELQYGELFLKGKKKQGIVICSYLEGSGRVNENLSGVVVSLQVYQELKKKANQYSYTFLILPGDVGFAAWCEKNKAKISDVALAVHLKMLGKGLKFSTQKYTFPNGENPLASKVKYPKFENICICGMEDKRGSNDPGSIEKEALEASKDFVLDFLRKQDSK